MRCLSPLSIPRPNGGGALDRITVPCGQCVICLENKRDGWSYRLNQEFRSSLSAFFITLTYADIEGNINDDEGLNLSVRDVQLFLKRLRKDLEARHKNELIINGYLRSQNEKVSLIALKAPKLRYYIVGEYGSQTMRAHYHGLMFNVPVNHALEMFEKAWAHGYVSMGTVTKASIHYVTKYMIGEDYCLPGKTKPFAIMSTKPGIGFDYIAIKKNWHLAAQRFYSVIEDGMKVGLPRYYRDKIFIDYEKRKNLIKTNLIYDEKENRKRQEILDAGINPGLNELDVKNELIRKGKKVLNKKRKI